MTSTSSTTGASKVAIDVAKLATVLVESRRVPLRFASNVSEGPAEGICVWAGK